MYVYISLPICENYTFQTEVVACIQFIIHIHTIYTDYRVIKEYINLKNLCCEMQDIPSLILNFMSDGHYMA